MGGPKVVWLLCKLCLKPFLLKVQITFENLKVASRACGGKKTKAEPAISVYPENGR